MSITLPNEWHIDIELISIYLTKSLNEQVDIKVHLIDSGHWNVPTTRHVLSQKDSVTSIG